MNEAKNTPGPWIVSRHGDSLIIVNEDNWITGQVREQDAKLIASSPVLLQALIKLVMAWDHNPDGIIGVAVINDARAAIAQAEGVKP